MGILQSYGLFVLAHPGKILFGGVTIILSLLTFTLIMRPLPSFRDPLVGFEARDTLITARLNAWKLLQDETSASANNLSLALNSPRYEWRYQTATQFGLTNELTPPDDSANKAPEPPIIEMSQDGQKSPNNNLLDEDEDEYYQSINSTQSELPSLIHYSLGSSKVFCGKLYEGYAQVVISPSTGHPSSGLFNLNSMLAICQLDRKLRLEQSLEDSAIFQKDCERFQIDQSNSQKGATSCCNSWSLPNYVACLNNKTSCMDLDKYDMKNTEVLLNLCAPFYFKSPHEECFNKPTVDKDITAGTSSLNALSSPSHDLDQWPRSYCGNIPDKCLKCDGWIYTVMHYLANENFIINKYNNETNRIHSLRQEKHMRSNTSHKESIVNKLTYSNIFLPIAKSSSLMKYYHHLSKYNLKTMHAQVKAMDLGLKNSLFEHLITDDTKLFIVALISILLVISLYTWSFILSSVILMIICLSLCLSYTIYEVIFNIPIFPFMNLLAVVISFGICSDNAMLFCKHWSLTELDECHVGASSTVKNTKGEKANLDRMLERAIVSTFVATLATACSFIISSVSKVVAVRCFCIFATLSVITNYLLIVVLLPPALILDSRFVEFINKSLADNGPKVSRIHKTTRSIREKMLRLGKVIHNKWILNLVAKYKFYLIVTFVTLLSCSSILVFYCPTLQPADEEDIKLLSSKHAFEQYDKNLRKQFPFERSKLGDLLTKPNQLFETPDTLPIRIVFGILPIDNGNHLDPQDRGSITFDPKFDLAEPNVQIWLLEFCQKLKQQRFVHLSTAPDLSNCFIDTFKSWMDTRMCRNPFQTDIDWSPCCQAYEFPYSRLTFNRCIGEALNIIRKTPQFNQNTNAGIRFFKNSTKVAALVIEYQSNRLYSDSFTKMDRFFHEVDKWVTWQINNTAPPSLKSGWFISSNLELLALQTELEQSTSNSILLEVLFAMFVLMISTRYLVLTLAGTMTIGTIIIVTIAVLIVLKWTLGVAESILISLTIGLSIDFALHYSVAYSESRNAGTSYAIINRILNEVGSPIALATTTTSLAGFVIIWSDILAYQELGVFLILIAFSSWIISTFFLLPMLATTGSIVEHGEIYSRILLRRALKVVIDRL